MAHVFDFMRISARCATLLNTRMDGLLISCRGREMNCPAICERFLVMSARPLEHANEARDQLAFARLSSLENFEPLLRKVTLYGFENDGPQ